MPTHGATPLRENDRSSAAKSLRNLVLDHLSARPVIRAGFRLGWGSMPRRARGATLIAPQHGGDRAALTWIGPHKVARSRLEDALSCAVVSPPIVWRPRAARPAPRCLSRRRFGGGRRRRGVAALSSPGDHPSSDRGYVCGILARPTVPSVRRRSLWIDQAGVRMALAVPFRGSSDASATPRTSSRCSPAPHARCKRLSSVAA